MTSRDSKPAAGITPSQTVGPYFAYGMAPKGRGKWSPDDGVYHWKETIGEAMATADVTGQRIKIEGCVTDGDGVPMKDALIEVWQADAQGRYADARRGPLPNAAFKGFGRSSTGPDGVYGFDTIKPGQVAGPKGQMQAPHIVVCLFARGMLRQVYTRLYFEGEAANASDPILALVPAERRDTLIAKKQTRGGDIVYRFDIRVQGDNETVFFDV